MGVNRGADKATGGKSAKSSQSSQASLSESKQFCSHFTCSFGGLREIFTHTAGKGQQQSGVRGGSITDYSLTGIAGGTASPKTTPLCAGRLAKRLLATN